MKYKLSDLIPFISGLPWLDEKRPEHLRRLPPRISRNLGKAIHSLSKCLSGAKLAFKTTAKKIKLVASVFKNGNYKNFSDIGLMGIDMYVDGRYWHSFINGSKVSEQVLLPSNPSLKEIWLYLPLYGGVKNLSLELDAAIIPADVLGDGKPMVFYGSSITQGGCASRPGLSYANQLGRMLGQDVVNLGFSGNGLGHLEIASFISGINPALVILDYGVNLLGVKNGLDIFKERYERFHEIIRLSNEETPIIFINIQGLIDERIHDDYKAHIDLFRQHVKQVHKKLRLEGDDNTWLLDGLDIIGMNDFYCTVDGVHPNDIGMMRYAVALHDFIMKNRILSSGKNGVGRSLAE
ncbi:MAG: SGNH/GDSL hydrolase family protein [Promethearchaeota archaeon]